MTRSDILVETKEAIDLIEKSLLTKEEKEKVTKTLQNFHDTLDFFWCTMLDCNKLKKKADDKGDTLKSNIAKAIRNIIAKGFKEPDFFKELTNG